jgi:hypothetical protein
VFLIRSLLWGHQSRFSILVGGYESKYRLSNLAPGLSGSASPPGLHSDSHRCPANFYHVGVKTNFIPNKNRSMKNHSIHSNRRAPAPAPPARSVCPSEVHLRHQPAAKNVSGGVGIRGHSNRADQWFTFRWASCIGHMLFNFSRLSRRQRTKPLCPRFSRRLGRVQCCAIHPTWNRAHVR